MEPLVILGIDPGFIITGFAILKRENTRAFLIDFGYLQMNSKKSLSERTGIFYDCFF